YTLDAYESAADAANALADEDLSTIVLADGFTDSAIPEGYTTPLYTAPAEACGSEDGVRALIHWQRGRYVITAEAVLPPELPEETDVILTDVVGLRIFEQLFAPVLIQEMR